MQIACPNGLASGRGPRGAPRTRGCSENGRGSGDVEGDEETQGRLPGEGRAPLHQSRRWRKGVGKQRTAHQQHANSRPSRLHRPSLRCLPRTRKRGAKERHCCQIQAGICAIHITNEGRFQRPRRSGNVGHPISRFRVLPCKWCRGLLRGHLSEGCGSSPVRIGLRHGSARLSPAAGVGPTCNGVLAACRGAGHADAGTRARSGGQGRQRSGRTGRKRGPVAINREPWRWVWVGRQ